MSENNGHRRCSAYAVPSSEVPLICSEKEWAAIRERDYRALRVPVSSWALPILPGPLLRPSRRDSATQKDMSAKYPRVHGVNGVFVLRFQRV